MLLPLRSALHILLFAAVNSVSLLAMNNDEKLPHDGTYGVEKVDSNTGVIHDKDLFGNKQGLRDDAMHYGQLSEEELVLEKQLRRKIDSVIMPMVIAVSKALPETTCNTRY